MFPTSDWGFKRLFGTEMNKDILTAFLNEVILPSTKKRRVVFDVYCRCEDNTRIIVEMQNCVTESFMDRSLVYSASSIIENYLYSKRKGYSANRTYLIMVAGETVFGNVEHSPVRLAQGLKEGEQKQRAAIEQIAEKMKAMGLSAEQIKEATGMDI